MDAFESLGLRSGIWQGILRRETPPARLVLVHNGNRVAEARAAEEPGGGWRIAAAIPPERLSDGVQSFLLLEDEAGEGDPPQPGALRLGSITLIAGELLDDDLRAELTLMRAELELLKKELRRLAASVSG
jgi:hypothetical protein